MTEQLGRICALVGARDRNHAAIRVRALLRVYKVARRPLSEMSERQRISWYRDLQRALGQFDRGWVGDPKVDAFVAGKRS